jgi:hypothetical protein
MKTWTRPLSLRRRATARRPGLSTRSAGRGVGTAARTADANTEPTTAAADHLLSEVVAAAMLVGRGTAARVVVCNAPATIDFDELRLIADRYDVRIEPVVRVGGGGVDLGVAARSASRG